MRAVGLLAFVLATSARAEPPAKPKPKPADEPVELPDVVKEASKATMPPIVKHGRLGVHGAWASGIVIEPKPHSDAKPYDRGGSVITPPDPNDPMALELGTNQLQNRVKREPWLPRDLSLKLKRGADHVWDWVLPKL